MFGARGVVQIVQVARNRAMFRVQKFVPRRLCSAKAEAKAKPEPTPQKKGIWHSAEWWGAAGAIAAWGMTGAAIYDASQKGRCLLPQAPTPDLLIRRARDHLPQDDRGHAGVLFALRTMGIYCQAPEPAPLRLPCFKRYRTGQPNASGAGIQNREGRAG